MALPYPPLNPGDPIPNNPFYYPPTNRLEGGDQGLVIIGAGLTITPEGVLNATGTGGTAVTTLTAGSGLAVSQPDGNVLITNTGVLSLTSGGGLSITGSGGDLVITNTAPAPAFPGTVTQIDTGFGLIGGPITANGTISLAPVSTVAPGTYTNATVTVDAFGRVTAASPGGGLGSLIQANAPLSVNASYPQTISINNASTASPGVVQLNTSTNSTSTTEAATPSAVKAAYDNANSALTNSASALSAATSALTAASSAQTTANNAQATAIVAQGVAATAQSVANSAIPCATFTSKGDLLAGTGASTFSALPLGTNGQVLTVCGICPTGLTWTTIAIPSGGIPCTCITAKGTLISGSAPGVVTSLPVGSDGFVLTADATCTSGLKWAAAASPTTSATPTIEGVIFGYADSATNFATALGYDALNTTVTGPGNVAIGTSAGCSLTSGQLNTYVGAGAGCANTIGNNNIALGGQTLFAQVSGDGNIAIGNLAGLNLTTESNNVFLGPYAGEAGCDNNIYISAGDGTLRMRVNECGAYDFGGLSYGTTGQVLTSSGPNSNPTWTTVSGGGGTPATPTVEGIVYGCTDCTNFNYGLGDNILGALTTGQYNIAIGAGALLATDTGTSNTAIGIGSLFSNTSGNQNVALGTQALFGNVSGSLNVAIGTSALGLATGDANTALGNFAGDTVTSGSNNIILGNGGAPATPVFTVTSEDNRIVVGNVAATNAYVQVAWTVVSDARDKTNVTALPVGLEFVKQLNPISYQFKESRDSEVPHGPVRYGFLAQEVLAAEGENPVLVDTENPEKLKITNDYMNAIFVKAIQELSAKVEALEAKLEANG